MKTNSAEFDPPEEWHHLLVPPGVAFVPRQLAGELARALGRVALDEAQRLRAGAGWILRDEEGDAVEQGARVLTDFGLPFERFTTVEPIAPAEFSRVRVARLEAGTLTAELHRESVTVDLAEIVAVDLFVVGQPRPALDKRGQEMQRWAEGMLIGLSYPALRQALFDAELSRPDLQAYIALPGRRSFLRIERGTRFPDLDLAESPQGLDRWLLFFDRLLASTPAERVLPEARAFWERAETNAVVRVRREEREQRRSWLRTWLDLHSPASGATGEDEPTS